MLLKAKELCNRADVLSEKGKLLIGFEQSWEMSRSKFWVIFSGIWCVDVTHPTRLGERAEGFPHRSWYSLFRRLAASEVFGKTPNPSEPVLYRTSN